MKKQLLLTLLLAIIADVSFAASLFNGNWRWRNNDGNETTATWRADELTSIEVASQGEVLRLRMKLILFANANDNNAVLEYSTDQINWTAITTAANNNPFVIASSNSLLTKDEETTQQLGSTGNTYVSGSVIFGRDNIDIPMENIDRVTEFEIVLLPTANMTPESTYYFRLHNTNFGDNTSAVILPTLTTTTTLPILLKNIKIRTSIKGNQIDWSTASEINNKYFDLERSSDGINWVRIAKIDGNGTTSAQSNYSYLDDNPLNGINYYRLVQHDGDGKINYTGVISAMFNLRSDELKVYPNPFLNQLNVNLAGYSGKTFKTRLTNAQGQVVFQNQLTANENGINIQLNQTQKPGIYVLNVSGNGVNLIKKLSVK